MYLVPRGDGRVVIGATVERVGFDRRVEPEAIEKLRAQAAVLWPPVATAEVEESWSGLRPGTSDSLPLIGGTGQPQCFIASGHFRNGILLGAGYCVGDAAVVAGRNARGIAGGFLPGARGCK